MKKTTNIFWGTVLDLVVLTLCYFLARVLLFLIRSFFYFPHDSNLPFTFFSVWFLLIFLALYFILNRRGLDLTQILIFLMIVFFLGNLSSGLTRWLVGYFPSIDKIAIVKNNFVGIGGVTDESGTDDDGNETMATNLNRSFVYSIGDERLNDEIKQLDKTYDLGASQQKFIFWQSALANGYNPQNISEYKCCNASERMFLYLTVGPLLILEFLIEATKDSLLILILFVGFRVRKKSLFPKDINALTNFFAANSTRSSAEY